MPGFWSVQSFSGFEPFLFFSNNLFSLGFGPVQDDFQYDFTWTNDEASGSVILSELPCLGSVIISNMDLVRNSRSVLSSCSLFIYTSRFDEWMTKGFTSFLTVIQSCQGDGMVIMKGSV